MYIKISLLLPVLFVCACEPVIDSRGYNPDNMNTSKIIKCKTTKEEVRSILGSPSLSAEIKDGSVWYYVAKKTETTSFFKPKIMEEDVLRVTFNKKEIVQSVLKNEKLNGSDLEADSERTSSTGYEESVSTSVVDDINRIFNPKKKKKTSD
jgi:outer membrane protein assembly factor BamE (lipoprotein component of BamABCDE complex)